MFSNVLAFILALGDPGVADAPAFGRGGPSPTSAATEPSDDHHPVWVFAADYQPALTPQSSIALPNFEPVVWLRRAQRTWAKHARLRAKVKASDLRQALARVRDAGMPTPAREVGPGVVINRDAGSPRAPDRARGFVRIGGGEEGDTLWREDDGLFYVTARINGAIVRLIVDTGASFTVLSAEDARRVGVDPGEIAFGESADTAAGTTPMARIVLANLEIGQNVAAGVPALVASGPLRTSLLGQNVLTRLGSVTIEGDRMTLR